MRVKIKLNNENIVKGYLCIHQTKPKLIKTACNFDEEKDIANAIEIEVNKLDEIKIKKQKYINGRLVDIE